MLYYVIVSGLSKNKNFSVHNKSLNITSVRINCLALKNKSKDCVCVCVFFLNFNFNSNDCVFEFLTICCLGHRVKILKL